MSARVKLYDKDHQVVWDSETSDQTMENFLLGRLGNLHILSSSGDGHHFAGPLRVVWSGR